MRCGFVVHAPAAVDELQTALIHQITHDIPCRVVLLLPPLPEESHFNVDESKNETRIKNKRILTSFSSGLLFFFKHMVGSGQKVIVPALSISLQFFYDTVQDVLDASFLNTGTGLGEEKKKHF